ncbi:hypothetical protein [Gemmiger sp. An120]|uniref:hypothetical protein n=1 Tax=Gemmiger sp. An120 TaxID=1965549 RepID=UPI00117AABBD|nr:hypothetical protein [Gemmiger sp. An120]
MDLILCVWTLGGVWLVIRALTVRGTLQDKAADLLKTERFLFGGWAAEIRRAAGGWLFLAAVVLLQFDVFFMSSLVREQGYAWYSFLAPKLEVVYFAAIFFKLTLFTRYSGWQWGAGWCFFFVSRWVFINNHSYWFILGILFALAAKDAPLRRTLKAGLAVSAASFLTVVLGAAAGLIPMLSDVWENGRSRYSFGYGWYTLTGAVLLGLCLMYVCWRQVKNLRWFDFVLLAAAAVFSDQGPDSRCATVCIVLVLVLSLLLRFAPAVAKPQWVRVLVSVAPAAVFLVSLLSGWLYDPAIPFWEKLNELFTGRLDLAHQALTGSHIAIAGQQLLEENFVVDNFYVAQWIYSGPVMSLLLWGAVTVLLWRLLKKGAVTESVCLVAMLAQAFMDVHFCWPCINVCLWLLPCVLYLLPAERTPSFAAEDEPR